GTDVSYYVKGQNLEDFRHDIQRYKVIISYNGKSFDIPFIERYFGIRLNHAHIDLRHILASLGYRGGLKGCEMALGIDRGDLTGVDGYFAVLLWELYQQTGSKRALETLLAYNIEDVLNLETLMVTAYNIKLKDTPFYERCKLDMPFVPKNPLQADKEIIQSIKSWIVQGIG
ncbi:MAG TPA: ribonuclease H-like domain-containing protein, partial [Thermodesulfovibrionia bacterium]|nr:ribonuclease H-like domain-containing protein [Thermodesulfovibrionia bacterium]